MDKISSSDHVTQTERNTNAERLVLTREQAQAQATYAVTLELHAYGYALVWTGLYLVAVFQALCLFTRTTKNVG